MQPAIKLEVTVPHIILSLRGHQVADPVEAEQQHSSERLRILLPGRQSGTPPGQYSEFAPVLSHDQKERFRLFQVNDIIALGGRFLLQILRLYPTAQQQGKRTVGQLRPSDHLAFTIEFHRAEDSSGADQVDNARGLVPGLNSIVIYLNAEGKPVNYSIDGARS